MTSRTAEIIATVAGAVFAVAALLSSAAVFIMLIYNESGLAEFFGTGNLSFMQAFGLVVLTLLLSFSVVRDRSWDRAQ